MTALQIASLLALTARLESSPHDGALLFSVDSVPGSSAVRLWACNTRGFLPGHNHVWILVAVGARGGVRVLGCRRGFSEI
jgi:hypothetical protein